MKRLSVFFRREKCSFKNNEVPDSTTSTEEVFKEVINGEPHSLETGIGTDTDQEAIFKTENSTDSNQETEPELVHAQQSVFHAIAEEKLIAAEKTAPSKGQVDGDDGWQPVQRPRSASSFGQRLKQRQGL